MSRRAHSVGKRRFGRTFLAVGVLAALLGAGQAAAGTTTYKYDALGRVIEVHYPDGSAIYYTYDAAGNRTQTTRQAGS